MSYQLKQELPEMDDESLATVIKDAQVILDSRDHERKKQAREKIRLLAQEAGLTVEIIDKGKRPKAPPKYQNPNNPMQTFNGIGVRPKWFKQLIEQGMTEEELLIKSGLESLKKN